jgi:hypothetical protein
MSNRTLRPPLPPPKQHCALTGHESGSASSATEPPLTLRIVFGLINDALGNSEDTGVSHHFMQRATTVTVGRFAYVKIILSGKSNSPNYSITGTCGRGSHNITWRADGWTPLL